MCFFNQKLAAALQKRHSEGIKLVHGGIFRVLSQYYPHWKNHDQILGWA